MAKCKSTQREIFQLCLIASLITLYLYPNILNAWELKENSDGIQVNTRENQGSEFKEFRGVTRIKASLNSIVALLDDTESYPNWYYNCREAKLLKRVSPVEGFTYSITETPWPTDDRDSILHFKRTQNAETKIVTMQLEGVADYIKQKPELTRIIKLQGYWKLAPLPDNMVEVTLQMLVDPGGNIPAWLANAMVVDMPYNSLLNMKKEVLKPKYKNAAGLVEEKNYRNKPSAIADGLKSSAEGTDTVKGPS